MDVLLALKEILFFSPFSSTHALVLWSAFGAALITFLYFLLRRARFGKALCLLRENGCKDESTARSAAALTAQKSVRRAFRSRDRLIAVAVAENGEKRYYLPSERADKAAYFEKAASFSAGKAVLYLALFYAVMLAFYHLWPIIERIWK